MDIKGHQASPGGGFAGALLSCPRRASSCAGLPGAVGCWQGPPCPGGCSGARGLCGPLPVLEAVLAAGRDEVLGVGDRRDALHPGVAPGPLLPGAAGGQRWQLLCGRLGLWDPHLVPECCCLSICCSPELGLNCCPSLAFQEGDV